MSNEPVRKKIICVDDVHFMLLSLKDRLKKHYEVYPAQSGEILFEILTRVKPDLIMLDISMPEADGYEIIRQLKDDIKFKEIPVIFMTGRTDKASAVKALELGAVDILFKPVSEAKLLERLDYQFSPEKHHENRPVILAVDDSPSILKSVNYALNGKYRVYTLPYPEKMEDVLRLTTPDLFLIDCHMPKISGFGLIDIIRKIPVHEETPIVFLTSERDNDTVFTAISRGVCDYIVKPVDDEILRGKMAAHLKDFMKRRIIRSVN
ncbi:MAG: response regulator [Oscillospiraceae bacterium]|nr:response regulator [Oscillospiraceae bacterium]